MNLQTTLNAIEAIVDKTETELVSEIKKIVFNSTEFKVMVFIKIAKDEQYTHKVRLACWYGVYIYYRRLKVSTNKLSEWVNDFSTTFEQEELFCIAKALVLKVNKKYSSAIDILQNVLNNNNQNVGYVATYVDIALSWLEDPHPNSNNIVPSSMSSDTIDHIQFLMRANPEYAKYHFFNARFLLLENNLVSAERELFTAIDLEDENTNDYILRVSDYQAYLSKIKIAALELKLDKKFSEIEALQSTLKAEQNDFNDKMSKVSEDFKESQKQGMQLLTVFIAVISILLSSLKGFEFETTEQLIKFELTLVISLLFFFGTLFVWISSQSILYKTMTFAFATLASVFTMIVIFP